MTEWADGADDDEAAPYESPEPLTPPSRGGILRWAMLWYVAVNLAIGLPLLLIPVQVLSLIGVDDATSALGLSALGLVLQSGWVHGRTMDPTELRDWMISRKS